MGISDDPFRDRLLRGERILWSGRPGGGIVFTARDAFLIPFSVIWCGFAIFWTFGAAALHAPSFFKLWGGMFVCIGLYFVFGRFLLDAWIRQRAAYAVTDRRILIARPRRFIAVPIDRLPDLELQERGDGRGTIRFGQQGPFWGNRGMAGWTPALDPVPQFIAIAEARRVFDIIQRAGQADR